MTTSTNREIRGVGGWLLLFVVLLILGLLLGFVGLYGALSAAEARHPQLAELDAWQVFNSTSWRWFYLFALLQSLVIYRLLFAFNPDTVRYTKYWLWWGIVVMPPIAAVFNWSFFFGFSGSAVYQVLPLVTGAAIWALVWTVYLDNSQRVANTYGLRPFGEGNIKSQPRPVDAAGSSSKSVHSSAHAHGETPGSQTATSRNSRQIPITEEPIYSRVAEELESGDLDKGLWTRLYAEHNGDERKTKSEYMRERFQALLFLERDRVVRELRVAQERARAEAEGLAKQDLESLTQAGLRFRLAVRRGDINWVREQLRAEPRLVNALDDDHTSPLVIAAEEGNDQLFSILMDNGADPNIADRHGRTAGSIAVEKGLKRIVRTIASHRK